MSIISDVFDKVLKNPNLTDSDKTLMLEAKKRAEKRLENGDPIQTILIDMANAIEKELKRRMSLN
jgi:hypothetical protein